MAIIRSVLSDVVSLTLPATIVVQPPLPRSRMYDITNMTISVFLFIPHAVLMVFLLC